MSNIYYVQYSKNIVRYNQNIVIVILLINILYTHTHTADHALFDFLLNASERSFIVENIVTESRIFRNVSMSKFHSSINTQ